MAWGRQIVAFVAAAWCTAFLAGKVPTVLGQQESQAEQLEELRQHLEEARALLNLTEEQVEQVRPILRTGAEAMLRVLQGHGIDLQDRSASSNRLRLRQLRRLQGDLKAVRKQTLKDLDKVLTDEQLEIYKKIQEEGRQAMQKRLRQRR